MAVRAFETVYTITDWYDGARGGIADFNGQPHYYKCEQDYGPTDQYVLQPLDAETFQLAMEDWQIWLRWEAAFDEGVTPLETHPALPADKARHAQIEELLVKRLLFNSETSFRALGKFKYGISSVVRWTLHKNPPIIL